MNLHSKNLLKEFDKITISYPRDRRIRVDIAHEAVSNFLGMIKGQGSYVHLSAISCVDWLKENEFELVYHCWSYEENQLISVHTRINRNDAEMISVYDIYKPAEFFERDIFEMYGITFIGSPKMEKFILTEWEGMPPMRKDFDAEAYVMDTFNWTDYHPDWLKDLEKEGGGIAIKPEDIRFHATSPEPTKEPEPTKD